MGILILNKQIACKVTEKYLYTQEFYKIKELYELTPRAKQPEFFYKKQHKQLARQSYAKRSFEQSEIRTPWRISRKTHRCQQVYTFLK